MAEKKSTQIYHDWIPTFDMIGRKDKAVGFDLIMSLLRHGASGEGLKIEDPDSESAFTAEVIYNHFAKIIDHDIEKYMEKCEKNRQNVSKRYQNTNVNERIRTSTKSTDKDKDKDKDKDIYIKRSKNKFKNFDERTYSDEEYAAMEGGRKP